MAWYFRNQGSLSDGGVGLLTTRHLSCFRLGVTGGLHVLQDRGLLSSCIASRLHVRVPDLYRHPGTDVCVCVWGGDVGEGMSVCSVTMMCVCVTCAKQRRRMRACVYVEGEITDN